TPLIAVNLKRAPELRETVPHELLKKFETCVVINQARKAALEAHTREVLEFLATRELPVMVLKGGALDRLVYREPW
ncbi:MAG: nucleotidyltransferase family protein, partial [Gammaproteobacteria bacterium]|nr:nucleotidyltransferase family protein [Gammaproteobacteria bacterium]